MRLKALGSMLDSLQDTPITPPARLIAAIVVSGPNCSDKLRPNAIEVLQKRMETRPAPVFTVRSGLSNL